MRFHTAVSTVACFAALSAFTLLARPAQAQITGLFNTGVAADGVTLLSPGATDTHYTFINGSTSTAAVVTNFQGPSPYAFDDASRYIWFNAAGDPTGTYRLRLTFNLAGDPATGLITGSYSTDNNGSIQLNGTTVSAPSPTYTAFTPFSINSGFVAGTNTLDFVVTNVDGPGALGVTNLKGSASGTGVPEPASFALLATTLLPAVGLVARRRKA